MTLVGEAIARYHKLIESEPYIDLAWAHALQERIKAEKLDGRPVSPVLRPHFLTNRDYAALERASTPAPVDREASCCPDRVAVVVLEHEAVSECGRESVDRCLPPRDRAWRPKFAKPNADESRGQAGCTDPNSRANHSFDVSGVCIAITRDSARLSRVPVTRGRVEGERSRVRSPSGLCPPRRGGSTARLLAAEAGRQARPRAKPQQG